MNADSIMVVTFNLLPLRGKNQIIVFGQERRLGQICLIHPNNSGDAFLILTRYAINFNNLANGWDLIIKQKISIFFF